MQNNSSSSSPRKMNRGASAFNLSESQYPFALNTIFESESGDSYNPKNESSNILNVVFPQGFKVVGHKTDILGEKTYYFLTNPDTSNSQIGYVDNTTRGAQVDETSPLETQTQAAYSEYVLLLEDSCNQCLNFHIDFPLKKIAFKNEKCGKTLYWADNRNPDRFINLDKLEDYLTTGVEVCGDDSLVEDTCLDCDKLRIDKKYQLPSITAVSIESGGQLEGGAYEFTLTYSDKLGNEVGEYVSITNPVHIFDSTNRTITNEELNEATNQAIKLKVEGLDPQFKYYKIIIVQKLLGSVSYFEEGIHPINDKEIIISTVREKTRTDINKLLSTKTSYVKSEGVTSSNGYLFRYGLTAEKEWNLQPISNLLGAFVRWQTVEAKETLYERGESSSLYKGFMRDEVYPLGIRFETSTGYKTALFPLISRPSEKYVDDNGKIIDEIEVIENKDVLSVNENNPNCSSEDRNKYWQFYNTAHDVQRCSEFSGETVTSIQPVDKYCINEGFDFLENGSIYLDIEEVSNFTTLAAYIEEFGNKLTEGYPADILELYDNQAVETLLTDIREDINCAPYIKDNCGELSLLDSNIFLGLITNEQILLNPKDVDSYGRSRISKNNFIHKVNDEGRGKVDAEFVASFLTGEAYPFEREITVEAERCSLAFEVAQRSELNENSLGYVTQYYGASSIAELQESTITVGDAGDFTNKIHKGALWLKSKITQGDKAFLEIPVWSEAQFDDLFSSVPSQGTQPTLGNTKIRLSVYTGRCNNLTLLQTQIVDVRDGSLLTDTPILKSDLLNDEFYVAIDLPIKAIQNGYTTAAINGTFALEVRAEEYESAVITFDKLEVNKQQKYTTDCEFEVPLFNECDPQPFDSGKFSYWESVVNYPDNKELYDSSELKIEEEDIDENFRKDFKKYFVSSTINGKHLLKEATNFTCKPIRHFKFPDFAVSPFMPSNIIAPFSESFIYPLGVTVDIEVVNNFLDIAVKNNLISQEQRDSITAFEIFRGDRRVNKSILGKGMAYDVYEYNEKSSGDKLHFSNFPFNDLGDNKLTYLDEERNEFVKHPYSGNRNDKFTVHSPDYDYYDLNIGDEVKFESYQYGTSRGTFDEVFDHSPWVILGDKAYRTASTLAALEYGLEKAIRIMENGVQAAQGLWVIGGLGSTGTGAVGASVGFGLIAVIEAVEFVFNSAPIIGRYRYEWLKIFRDLGQPENFAYQYAAEGFYNFAEPNVWYDGIEKNNKGNSLRGVSISKKLKEGRYIYTDRTGEQIKINNLDREHSLFLSLGDHPIDYPISYKNFDNTNIDPNGSSRTIQSQTQCSTGKSEEVQKNIASPYVSIKNYVPFQYNEISSIKWLPTTRKVNLKEDTDCYAIFGGDTYISRYTVKRKTPLFTATAFGLAPLTPYDYYRNSNIGYARFYANYEISGERNIGDILFPDFESEYNFDCQTSKSGSYIKPPSKFYLYYYGIPNFLVESEINLNLRYGKPDPKDNFYPEVGDVSDWVQERNVSIREPNTLNYNNIYSSQVTTVSYRTLPDYYSKEEFDCIYDSPNGVIYSMQDTSENDLSDPWLIFRPLDYHQFPTSYGKLIDLEGIESAQVLGRFENTSVIFNAVNQFKDANDASSRELGTGGIFAARPMEFSNTELGYGGSQTYQLVSNEYGHFFPDAEKGQVFQANAKSLQEISSIANGEAVGMKAWFKEHLPFKIKDSLVSNYADIDTDNALNGVGITLGWDSKFDRVLLTKVDYVPLQEMYYCGGNFLNLNCNPIEFCQFVNKQQTIQDYLEQGYKYIEEDCQLIFQKYTEACTYSFTFCDFSSVQSEIDALITQGYSLKEQNDCTRVYEISEEVCDPTSKQAEIQALLDQGYSYYSPVDCDYTDVQDDIDTLLSDGYIEVLDTNCTKTFEKSITECDPTSKQAEIQDLLNQGFVEVSRNGCDIVFERNTDLTASSNGASTAETSLIDIQGEVSFFEGNSNGNATAVLNLSVVSTPLLVGTSLGTSSTVLNIFDSQPNLFIGGVAGNTINTSSDLSTKLFPTTTSDIWNFSISGTEVKAYINRTYGVDGFVNNTNITYLRDTAGRYTNSGSGTGDFQNCSNFFDIQAPGLTSGSLYGFFATKLTGAFTFQSLIYLVRADFNFCSLLTELYLPELLELRGSDTNGAINAIFNGCTSLTKLYMPKCNKIGGSVLETGIFVGIKIGCEITCSSILATNNAGGEDGDIAYARNTRNCTIIYI